MNMGLPWKRVYSRMVPMGVPADLPATVPHARTHTSRHARQRDAWAHDDPLIRCTSALHSKQRQWKGQGQGRETVREQNKSAGKRVGTAVVHAPTQGRVQVAHADAEVVCFWSHQRQDTNTRGEESEDSSNGGPQNKVCLCCSHCAACRHAPSHTHPRHFRPLRCTMLCGMDSASLGTCIQVTHV
jgi:hypothetical protein